MSNKYYKKGEPITSYGIINIHLSGELNKYNNILKNAFDVNAHINVDELIIDTNDNKYKSIYKMVERNLLFLLVSRKNSLGYIEFIRGNYDISDNNESVKHLFVQMTDNEIKKIFSYTFDDLWCDLWKKNARKSMYTKEYLSSSEKFNVIIPLFNKNSFKPEYPINEWGFPKGKKKINESNIICAIRECCEETSLINTEMFILPGVNALIENMIGTDNKNYKHVYYLSVIDELRNLSVHVDNYHFIEIDMIGWFKKNVAINLIRPYHTEKLRLIDEVIKYVAYVIHRDDENKII